MKLGLTLPSFADNPEPAVAVALAAEAAGLDGVFVYDHLFRFAADGRRRPALECVALLAAVAAATDHITIGTLVARASLRPSASLTAALETVARVAPGRLIASLGAGDSESRSENESFGLSFGTVHDRVRQLHDAIVGARDHHFPVWVGGTSSAVRDVAARVADGWNAWGLTRDGFEVQARAVRTAADREPFACSWGGLVVLADDDAAAQDKAQRLQAAPSTIVGGPARAAAALAAYATAGADWLIVGPVDAGDPRNADVLGRHVAPHLESLTGV